jgi:dipeptidyl aminopeptidase/acylaminoacyl peptidase
MSSSLWLAEVDKTDSARQLTNGDFNDYSATFSPDSKSVTFLSDRPKSGGAGHLYRLDISDANPQVVALSDTSLEKGISDYKWSPSGKHIAFLSNDETSPEKAKRNANKDDVKVFGADWDYSRLRILDIDTKEVRTVYSQDATVGAFSWAPDSKALAILTGETPQLEEHWDGVWTLGVVDIDDGAYRPVCGCTGGQRDLTWRISETGGAEIFWLRWTPGSCNSVYHVVVPLRGEGTDPQIEARQFAYGVDSTSEGLLSCNGGRDVIVHVLRGLRDELHLLPTGVASSKEPQVLLSQENALWYGYDAHIDDDAVTLAYSRGIVGGFNEAFSQTMSRKSSASQSSECQLSKHNTAFAALNTVSVSRSIHCHSSDGLPLDGVLLLPNSRFTGPRPLVVNIHGGPYFRVTHTTNIHFEWAEYLVSLGYAVLMPNYRGSTGRGAAFAEATIGAADAGYEDVMAMTRFVLHDDATRSLLDKDRVVVTGYSYGGYMTYVCATRQASRGDKDGFKFKTAIAGAGISSFHSLIMTIDISRWARALVGESPWDEDVDNEKWHRLSPIHRAKDVDMPLLIIQPEEDTRIPKEQAIGFYRAMEALGKKDLCELVLYPREGHGFPVPWEKAHYEDMLTRVRTWLEKYMP